MVGWLKGLGPQGDKDSAEVHLEPLQGANRGQNGGQLYGGLLMGCCLRNSGQ